MKIIPYFIIGGKPIYISRKIENEFIDLALEKGLLINNLELMRGEARRRVADYVYNNLLIQYNKDPKDFLRNWENFEFEGKEASDNAWDLINYYCEINGLEPPFEEKRTTASVMLDSVNLMRSGLLMPPTFFSL